MVDWRDVLELLKDGKQLVKIQKKEPAWMIDDMPVYNNTVKALFSRELISINLTDNGVIAKLSTKLNLVELRNKDSPK